MSMLSDFFIAGDAEVAAMDVAAGPAALPSVHAKRVDPVKVASLTAILTGTEPSLPDPVRDAGEGGPSVYRFADEATAALGALGPDDATLCAYAWARTEEWQADGAEPAEVESLLQQVRELAARAKVEGKRLYVWTAL
jgi:hypothetical protein